MRAAPSGWLIFDGHGRWGELNRARLPPACARSAEWCRRTGGACRLQRARPLLWGGEGPARAAAQGAGAMTAWTICKGILLAVGILFIGIPLAAGYLWLFVALVLEPVLGSAALNWRDHPGFQPPTTAARCRVQTRPTASAVLGGAVRDTPHPEPGNLMADLGRGLPRIVCVRLGSARQFSGLNVVRPLPPSGP